jgi:ATP-dependent Lon protease
MLLPAEIGIMTLSNATLFPNALLPLYIFEQRYRRMLKDALNTHRLFCISMQKHNCTRESPEAVAGIGLIRVSVQHEDGTSHVILQGLRRVALGPATRYRPYRVQPIQPLEVPPCDSPAVDALVEKVRELMAARLELGLPLHLPPETGTQDGAPPVAAKEILRHITEISNPEHVADLVGCALLQRSEERQTILATLDVEARLRHLVRFLIADIQRQRLSPKS